MADVRCNGCGSDITQDTTPNAIRMHVEAWWNEGSGGADELNYDLAYCTIDCMRESPAG